MGAEAEGGKDPRVRLPRVMIAAPHGRSGKTTVSIGVVAALTARGLAVQPFKKGPDYIDPSWLTGAGGRACRNLDLFMMGPEGAAASFLRGSAGADVSIIEGAMGLYDGLDLEGNGSSAALARLLETPVLLVVDATRMTRSVAALVGGFQRFEPGVRIAGVVLNNVARSRHESILVGAIERYCGIPVVGSIPRRPALTIQDRHLGLVPRGENEERPAAIEEAREVVERHVNLDLLLEIARSAPNLEHSGFGVQLSGAGHRSSVISPAGGDRDSRNLKPETRNRVRVGVLRDRVFTFYYPENLEALRDAGAELAFVDALADPALPDVDALYIGGGFPEVFMEGLEANASLRLQTRERAAAGMPIYAECAGLIYLSRRVKWGERSAEMAGVLPCEIEMTPRPQGHGYVAAEVVRENPFFPTGQQLRGHEFHNTRVSHIDGGDPAFAYRLTRGSGMDGGRGDGLLFGNVLASYTHLHAFAVPGWAERFVEAAERQRCRPTPG